VRKAEVVLVRVGVDAGSGGVQGPLFSDNTFEYVPIPDGDKVDPRKYGNTLDDRHGRHLVEYFPQSRQGNIPEQSIHFDPEFDT
jgi:putative DNA base modification enzyme with NMAD domain